ncbi:hypothetical protein SLEP1_g25273 [Rubroshorea leprosula]|uniref:F-box domain-containing protein n=1 Tax=Rubroshorea leprosula TaxID=152421 RepID=A0AAV5JID6_9ROSI|nr:hypothetical protein SLEP1_g25273 [Rubroshorea leprosula]
MAKCLKLESSDDRISALPDEVLIHILSFLPTQNAVTTSVLSKRWRYLYTLVSSLDLMTDVYDDDRDLDEVEKASRFMNFVDRALFFRDIPSIVRFRLAYYQYIDPMRIDGWLRALMWHNIQEIDLCNYFEEEFQGLPLPAPLFCCETLVVLKVNLQWNNRDLKVPSRIWLPNLKILHIRDICFPDDASGENLFSSCPVLEEVVLHGCFFGDGCLKFKISSSALKRLTIESVTTTSLPDKKFQIMINTPNLVYLNYSISGNQSLVLVNVQSLAEVLITCDTAYYWENPAAATDVFRGIKDTQSLHLSNNTLVGLKYHEVPIPSFEKMTYLKIWDWDFLPGSDVLEYFLAHCVVLETLVFEEQLTKGNTSIQYSLQKAPLARMLCRLKKIVIRSLEMRQSEAYMQIIEFFLNNASILEELNIHITRHLSEQQEKMMVNEILARYQESERNLKFSFMQGIKLMFQFE